MLALSNMSVCLNRYIDTPLIRLKKESNSNRVAVLPLDNVSEDPHDSYFADGLTDELISTLSKVKELNVISRTSVMQYKNKPKVVRSIGKELDVGTLLEGSVRKAGNNVRIAIQMIDAKHDTPIWAERYDREIQNIFAIQTEIAERVTEALKLKLLPSEKARIEKVSTENTEAYKLYLKGRHEWDRRAGGEIDAALKCFQAAVELDPQFAMAYAGLADSYAIYSLAWIVNPGEALTRAKEYALKALEIDPNLAEAHSSLGYVYAFYDWKWADAEEEIRRAIELKPSYATSYFWYGKILCYSGRLDEAYDKTTRAAELDPLSNVTQAFLSYILISMKKWDQAIEQCIKTIKNHPGIAHIHRFLAWAYYAVSRNEDAIEEMRKAISVSGSGFQEKAEYAILLDSLGRRSEANLVLEDFNHIARTASVPSLAMAEALLSVGRTDEALSYLKKAVMDERGERLQHFRVWPFFDRYRNDQRWHALVNQMRISYSNVALIGSRDEDAAHKFKFQSPDRHSKMIFDFLVKAFIEDYMRKRLFIEQSGWRSLIQVAAECKLPRYSLYSRQGGCGPTVTELLQKGLVESRTFTGHRGRGGEVMKIRIAYDREPTKRYVDEMALIS